MATVILEERVREQGKSYVLYYKDPLTGQRKYHKSFRRKVDAQQEANKLRAMIDTGKLSDIAKAKRKFRPMAFSEVAGLCEQTWRERRALGEISQSTLDNYTTFLAILGKAFGPRLLLNISKEDVLAYRAEVAVGKSNCSANRQLFILKQVFKKAQEIGAVPEDHAAGIGYLNERQHERTSYLMPAEIDRLLAASRRTRATHYLPAIILLAVEHGASRQEILGLEWSHIDFDHGLIRFFRTKNGVERTMHLMPRCRVELQSWREHLERSRAMKGVYDVQSDSVFCRLDGTPIKEFRTAWNSAAKAAGLADYHFHDNRHTFCSNIIHLGGTLKDAGDMIGHRDLRMTNRYSHLSAGRQKGLQTLLAEHYGQCSTEAADAKPEAPARRQRRVGNT